MPRRGLPAMIAVPHPCGRPERSDLTSSLDELGWTRARRSGDRDDGHGRGRSRARPPADAAVTIDVDARCTAWLASTAIAARRCRPSLVRLLTSAPWQAFGSVRADGETIAIGRVAAQRRLGWPYSHRGRSAPPPPRPGHRGHGRTGRARAQPRLPEPLSAGHGRQRHCELAVRPAWASPTITATTTASTRPARNSTWPGSGKGAPMSLPDSPADTRHDFVLPQS